MTVTLALLLLLPMLQSDGAAPVGRAAEGKTAWNAKLCKQCHGSDGQGGYGPDLAGRGLNWPQFERAVRSPWGVMPAFTEKQLPTQMLADMAAYLADLPKVKEPGAWTLPVPPPNTPRGQALLIGNGCGQCHQAELRQVRMQLGGDAAEADFAYFSKRVYEHTDIYPEGFMGNFSKLRLPESILQEIFRFAKDDLGLMPTISAAIPPGVADGPNTTYTLTLKNGGAKGKGLTAEDVTVALALPKGRTVVKATGDTYKGVLPDADLKSDAAVWRLARVSPEEQMTYTITVSGSGAPADVFKGSVVRWIKPEIRKTVPNLALRDPRIPGKHPQTPVAFPPPKL